MSTGIDTAGVDGAAMQLRYAGATWNIHSRIDWSACGGRATDGRDSGTRGSSTAMGTALMRAAHSRLDPKPLFFDDWGDRLVPDSARHSIIEGAMARARALGIDPLPEASELLDDAIVGGSAFANVILRSRYCEDALRNAVARGIRQYVLLGAGFDSFALRAPPFASDVSIFEIDRPEAQALKRRRMIECAVPEPSRLHFLTADLTSQSLTSCLDRSSYRADEAAFFSWLGVTMFLTRDTCLETLRAIAHCSAPGSELVFTYFDDAIFGSPTDRFLNMQAYLQSVGEPLRGGFAPATLAHDLHDAGFDLLEDTADAVLLDRYGAAANPTLIPLAHSRIAWARVRSR